MRDKDLLIRPEKLMALKKQVELRLNRRKKIKDLLLPINKTNFISKLKNLFFQ